LGFKDYPNRSAEKLRSFLTVVFGSVPSDVDVLEHPENEVSRCNFMILMLKLYITKENNDFFIKLEGINRK